MLLECAYQTSKANLRKKSAHSKTTGLVFPMHQISHWFWVWVEMVCILNDLSSFMINKNYAILVNAIGATCDIVIACAMVFYLRQSRTSIKRYEFHLYYPTEWLTVSSRTNHLLRSIVSVAILIVCNLCQNLQWFHRQSLLLQPALSPGRCTSIGGILDPD